MSDNFMPLSGAILVTNPRRSTPMGIALENPNDRRALNAMARAVVKKGVSAEEAVAMMFSGKSADGSRVARVGLKAFRAKAGLMPVGNKANRLKGAQVVAGIAAGKTMSKADKKVKKLQYAKAKRQIANLMAAQAGYGKGYAGHVLGSKAGRYLTKAKRMEVVRVVSPRNPRGIGSPVYAFGRKEPYHVVTVASTSAANVTRGERRVRGGGKQGEYATMRNIVGNKKRGGGGFKDVKRQGAAAGGGKTQAPRRAATPKALSSLAGIQAANAVAKNNPGIFGDGMFGGIALENPTVFGAMPVLKYGAITGAAAAGGLFVHYKAVPWVSANVYTKVPVIGQYLVQYNYAATGLLAGTVLAGVAARLEGDARTVAGLVATGVFAAGGMLQLAKYLGLLNEQGEAEAPAFELTEEEVVAADPAADLSGMFGGIALENGHLHGIAMENEGMFGGLGYGDGMAYQTASLIPPGLAGFDQGVSDYAGSSPADALYSGADLDMEEGQAACAGQSAYQAKFGHPPVRISAMGGQVTHSHLAGRQGHRWGWLVKMVGFNRFQQIAALPPAQRLAILRKMRAAALAAYKQELSTPAQLPSAENSPTDVSGTTAVMSGAASGADSSYGAMLFAGPDYLR